MWSESCNEHEDEAEGINLLDNVAKPCSQSRQTLEKLHVQEFNTVSTSWKATQIRQGATGRPSGSWIRKETSPMNRAEVGHKLSHVYHSASPYFTNFISSN